MKDFHLFDQFPLWLTFLTTVAIILFATWIGVVFARWRKTSVSEDNVPLNTLVGANLALLAFILAFTFGLTTNRFDGRKIYMLEEINTIETTFLRADLVSEPTSTEIKDLLKEYVRIRVIVAKDPEMVKEVLTQSSTIQRSLWSLVTDLAKEEDRNDAVYALLIESVNEMFDNQTRRVAITQSHRIPGMLWLALFVIVMFSMFAVGYLIGNMEKPNLPMILALSLAFSAVILVIIDLDSMGGTIQINHQPTFDLYQRLLDR